MNITKVFVDKLPIPKQCQVGRTEQKRYYDDKLKGFGVRVTSGGTKSFFVEKLIHGKLKRITLGQYPAITTEQARKEAQKIIGQIATGRDPISEKQAAKVKGITLKQVCEDYLHARKELKPKTRYDYERVFNIAFAKWHSKPLLSITKDQVIKYHGVLGEEHGKAYANFAMRVLRALFNFSAAKYEDAKGQTLVADNPTKGLSQMRAWYRVEKRRSYIKSHELAEWYEALAKIDNSTLRDYLLFILFTGLRREEAARLRWADVDLKAKAFTILDTKNHIPHVLPLSDYLFELLTERKRSIFSDCVFPGSGKSGYIVEPRKQMAKVIEATGIQFTVHDLRRTFITMAEGLDIPAYALKRLLNHQMANDVTAGYIITDVERLRKPMEEISEYLLKCMGLKKSANIISFASAKHKV